MTPSDQQAQANRITILLMLMVASNANSDYTATELMKIPLTKKVVRQEVKMLFNQLRSLNDRLMLSMQRHFDFEDADNINLLAEDILQAGFCLTAATAEQRKELIEQMVSTLEAKHLKPAA